MSVPRVPTVHVRGAFDREAIWQLEGRLGALLAAEVVGVHALVFVEEVAGGIRVRVERHVAGITSVSEAIGETTQVATERCLVEYARGAVSRRPGEVGELRSCASVADERH